MLQIKTSESFSIALRNVSKKGPAVIEIKGSRRVLRSGYKKLAEFRPGPPNKEVQSKQARTLMRSVRSAVTRYINKNNLQVPEIKKMYPVVYTNRLFWESIPNNTDFYIIDAKHAYWRIAYLLGYIGKGLYKKYAEDKTMKTVRNISLAILNSSHKCEYYEHGQKIAEITCDTSLYSRVYNNIRYFSYNLCGRLRNDLDSTCFAYRTDGVFLLRPGLVKAKKIFESYNLLYKIEKCVKIDDKTYSTMDGELKKFA